MEKITALVLFVRKHLGNTVVVDTYTKEIGRQSFIYSFTKTNKGHKALLSPMNWVNFHVGTQNKGLARIKDLTPLHIYKSIGVNPVKNLVMLFLSEIIANSIREENADKQVFDFIESALLFYDELSEDYANFHLIFVARLTGALGFLPPSDDKSSTVDQNFNLWESKMNRHELEVFRKIVQCPVSQCTNIKIDNTMRSRQLNILLDYYMNFAGHFRMPKSLELFREF